ncbi:MAG: polyprenyl synthetase family protein [Saprospiraceae bacterium]
MSSKLNKIKAPISQELIEFEKRFKNALKTKVALLDKITYYIVQRKGKQMRPMFVFLCAKMCGKINDSSYVAASLIEIMHTSTLVHDDVVDDSNIRRGLFSINALWKNKIAVLVGDYLLSRGLLLALDNKEYKHLHILATAVKSMSEGELLQLEKARKLDIQEDVYYDIIRAKTASLIASSCMSGAASVTDDESIIEKARLLGEFIGMAFQIKDDLFDYGDSNIGKPKGIDIKEKKMTLPLIYALQQTDKKTKKYIINAIKKDSTNPKKVKEVISFVKENNGLEYAEKVMKEFQQKAFTLLEEFPDNEARVSIRELIAFVVERKK